MEGFCRSCLINYDPKELLQYTEKNKRLYCYLTGLQVNRNDIFPFQLCKDCNIKMKQACNFKKRCRTSDKRLKHFMALKEADDNLDFCTFMKNNDDSMMMFRLPLTSGNSTPVFQRQKDDDNESGCTSIRNFMTDILRADDIPDNEVQKIREVIEDEANVLDDSLDSHWLQDDNSLDNNDLQFDISAFSTPRTINNDRCITPLNLKDDLNQNLPIQPANDDIDENDDDYVKTANDDSQNTSTDISELINSEINKIQMVRNFYVPNAAVDSKETRVLNKDKLSVSCSIEKNLSIALKDQSAENFALDDLLRTSPVHKDVPGFSTPTINDILFGNEQCEEPDSDQDENVEVDDEANDGEIDSLFLNLISPIDKPVPGRGVKSIRINNPPEPKYMDETNYDLDNFTCKICLDKKFSNLPSLKIHMTKIHQKRIKESVSRQRLCEVCGKPCSDRLDLIKHQKTHKPEDRTCKYCDQIFSSDIKLKMHQSVHRKIDALPDIVNKDKDPHKRMQCSICGATYNLNYLELHMRRHLKLHKFFCDHCHKGFCRKFDLQKHMVKHSNVRQFKCNHCQKKFSRRDNFSKHIETHNSKKVLQCHNCDKTYTSKLIFDKHYTKCEGRKTTARSRIKNKTEDFKVAFGYNVITKTSILPYIIANENNQEKSELKRDNCIESASYCSQIDNGTGFQIKCKVCRGLFKNETAFKTHWAESRPCLAMRAMMRHSDDLEIARKRRILK